MNEKKAKTLRKEMRKFFGNPTTEVRKYQVMNKRMVPVFDEKGKPIYDEVEGKKKLRTEVIDGTIQATGLRRLYHDTKRTVKEDRL